MSDFLRWLPAKQLCPGAGLECQQIWTVSRYEALTTRVSGLSGTDVDRQRYDHSFDLKANFHF